MRESGWERREFKEVSRRLRAVFLFIFIAAIHTVQLQLHASFDVLYLLFARLWESEAENCSLFIIDTPFQVGWEQRSKTSTCFSARLFKQLYGHYHFQLCRIKFYAGQ